MDRRVAGWTDKWTYRRTDGSNAILKLTSQAPPFPPGSPAPPLTPSFPPGPSSSAAFGAGAVPGGPPGSGPGGGAGGAAPGLRVEGGGDEA